MRMFSRNKDLAVQSFLLKLVNNNCAEVGGLIEGPRLEGRVNLTVATLVVPIEDKRPVKNQAFVTVTKEFSTRGAALVLDRPRGLDEAILGFRWEGQMHWSRAQAKHLNPLGGGFFQLGLRMVEVVHEADYPELLALTL